MQKGEATFPGSAKERRRARNSMEPNNSEPNGLSSGEALKKIYKLLEEGGYNPVAQIVGYLLSEDPTYITNVGEARKLLRDIDRDEMMNELVRSYMGVRP